jgi:hypothetical protein
MHASNDGFDCLPTYLDPLSRVVGLDDETQIRSDREIIVVMPIAISATILPHVLDAAVILARLRRSKQ